MHAHVYASAAAAAAATVGTGVPLVVTEHTEALWRSRRARWVSRWIYRRARCVIAVSEVIRRRLVERDAVPPGRITVVPNAVTTVPDEQRPAPPALPADCRRGTLVGVVARLQPEKGIAIFLKAAARVAPLSREARFLVVGDGPLRRELGGLVERLGLEGRVHFLGFRSDARELIEGFDVLVVPSFTEGAPLVVLEAMAAGVPVVASAVGGIPDQVRHGRAGLLIPPGDPAALGDALLGLLRDPARARRLGEAGRRQAASRFGHEAVVRQIEAVYDAALGQAAVSPAAPEEPELRTAR